MSGPKDSKAEIERRRREALERQRREHLRRVANLQSEIRRLTADFKNLNQQNSQLAKKIKSFIVANSLSHADTDQYVNEYIKASTLNLRTNSYSDKESLLSQDIEYIKQQLSEQSFIFKQLQKIENQRHYELEHINLLQEQEMVIALIKEAIKKNELELKNSQNYLDKIQNKPNDLINNFKQQNQLENILKSLDLSNAQNSVIKANIVKLKEFKQSVEVLKQSIVNYTGTLKEHYVSEVENNLAELSQKLQESYKRYQEELRQKEALAKEQQLAKEKAAQEAKLAKEQEIANYIVKVQNEIQEYYMRSGMRDDFYATLNVCMDDFKEYVKSVNNDFQSIKNYYAIVIIPKLKTIDKENKAYQEMLEKYNTLISEYELLCGRLKVTPETFAISEDGIQKLKYIIAKYETELDNIENQKYICDVYNEVMAEMGYPLLGKLKESVDDSVINMLYDFDNGATVSVTLSGGDTIFEIGQLSDTDRELDMAERVASKHDMEIFCDKYQIIKEKLKEKHVIIDPQNELPPSEEYAQVFNVNDYDIVENAQSQVSAKLANTTTNKISATNDKKRYLEN